MMCKIIDGKTTHFFICPTRAHRDSVPKSDENIPQFYSFDHAYDMGWSFTRDTRFSKDGKTFGVCPEYHNKLKEH